MNNKNLIINVILIIIVFFCGMLTDRFLKKSENNSSSQKENLFFSLSKSQIDTFTNDLKNYQLVLARNDVKQELTICNQLIYLYSNFPVAEYDIYNQRNNEEIVSSLTDTILKVLPSINKEYLSDNYKTLLKSLADKEINNMLKLSYLFLIEHSLMNDYLSYVYRNSITLSQGQLSNIASANEIKLGETYRSQLIFSIKDITANKNLVELLSDTSAKQVSWDGNTYVEKPTTRGAHHHDLVLLFSGFYGERGWTTSIDYDVK